MRRGISFDIPCTITSLHSCTSSSSLCLSSCLSGWLGSLWISCNHWRSRVWSRASWSTPSELTELSQTCCWTPWMSSSRSPRWTGRYNTFTGQRRSGPEILLKGSVDTNQSHCTLLYLLCSASSCKALKYLFKLKCKLSLLFLITQNFELKQLKKGGTWTESVNTKEINWYPLQKVNFARRKLEGANPAAITRYILRSITSY